MEQFVKEAKGKTILFQGNIICNLHMDKTSLISHKAGMLVSSDCE